MEHYYMKILQGMHIYFAKTTEKQMLKYSYE